MAICIAYEANKTKICTIYVSIILDSGHFDGLCHHLTPKPKLIIINTNNLITLSIALFNNTVNLNLLYRAQNKYISSKLSIINA